MSPGKLIENPDVRPYRPPRRTAASSPHGNEAAEPAAEQRLLEQARAQARAEVERELQAERERLQRSFGEAIAKLEAVARDIAHVLHEELPVLALEIAGRIVRARIDDGDEVARRVLDELLSRPLAGAVRRVRLHPDDLAAAGVVEERLPEGAVEIVADAGVGRGGVVVETEEEEVDARLRTAFRAFWDALMEGR